MRWLRSLFGGSSQLRANDVTGCVVVGGNSGIVYQIYNGGDPPEPPSLPWDPELPPAGPLEIFNLLSWKSRLSQQLIGREQHKQDLLDWAAGGRANLRIRLLTGPGGAGKTRLAAEVAQSLREAGWHAGFTPLGKSVPRPLSDKGVLLIIDYPEEWRPEIRALFQSAARMDNPPAPVRVLLLSRQPMDQWRDDIIQAGASASCDSYEVAVGPLEKEAAARLFCAVAERLADHRHVDAPRLDDAAIMAWIERDPALHPLPLFTSAAAIHAVIKPGETLGLSGAQIITALVERERRRLDAAGRDAGWGEYSASRLAGLAALRDGLDADALRRLAAPRLEIGLPPPEQIVDAVKSFGWWEKDRLPAPGPDLVAAELLRQILRDRPDMAPEWIWAALSDPAALELPRLDLLAHDAVILHGPGESVLPDGLVRAVADDPERAEAWRKCLDSGEAGFRLSPVGIAIANVLLKRPGLSEDRRATILNNLSVRLNEIGDGAGVLMAIREAVDIGRRLAQENPARFAADLASSLNNLSNGLRNAGDGAGALAAIREAVDTYRRLAQENPARFAPEIATSLNNLSNRLSDAADGAGGLTAIHEAVEIRRRLAQENPARFSPEFATSLVDLSNRLSDAGDSAGALAAIGEAVEIRRRLAQGSPAARFVSDLAQSLNNLSNRLSDAGDSTSALAAIREAVEIRRRLPQENPVRFASDLAQSLINLSILLRKAGDEAGAEAAAREAAALRGRRQTAGGAS